MLPRRLRLPRAAFSNTGKEMRAVSPHFSVSIRKGMGGIAAVVSKKTEKTSVGRHRLKRRMVSVAAAFHSPTHAIVIYARSGASALPFKTTHEELVGLLGRLLGTPGVR